MLRIFALPALLFGLSILAYGLWPLHATATVDLPWNAAPMKFLAWPSILIGLVLFIKAIQKKNTEDGNNIAMAASPFFSPYVGTQSLVAILPALIKTNAIYVVWLIVWGWTIFRMIQAN